MMMTPFYIVIGIGAVMITALLLVLIIAATKPDRFRSERSIDISAPPAKVFPLLDDLKQQRLWSPYEQKDPDMKRTYSGAERGAGAIYEWDGDKNIGAGRQEIIAVTPNERIEGKIDFFRPMKANNRFELLLKPAANGTNVTWAIFGPMPFSSRVFSIFMDFDKMIGNDFEKGLLQLKQVAERP
ncbi:MAG TPA: SRPBCC family protein [Xanthobacteraceae bacterium]|nr:SRPBCC family protein [Xanthobacteraceae bacterium]